MKLEITKYVALKNAIKEHLSKYSGTEESKKTFKMEIVLLGVLGAVQK